MWVSTPTLDSRFQLISIQSQVYGVRNVFGSVNSLLHVRWARRKRKQFATHSYMCRHKKHVSSLPTCFFPSISFGCLGFQFSRLFSFHFDGLPVRKGRKKWKRLSNVGWCDLWKSLGEGLWRVSLHLVRDIGWEMLKKFFGSLFCYHKTGMIFCPPWFVQIHFKFTSYLLAVLLRKVRRSYECIQSYLSLDFAQENSKLQEKSQIQT